MAQHHAQIQRERRRRYGEEDKRAVLMLAEIFDQISSRRLRAALDAELPTLRRQGHLPVSKAYYGRLRMISPATMDRLRQGTPHPIRRRGGTKPGTLLKQQIPVRTFAEWDDKRPGFEEIDLVQHDGGNPSGFFACTLTVTDVATGWTDLQAVENKAQSRVFAALQHTRRSLPFDLRGIDYDNGGEFINNELWRYCEQEGLTFTRGRVGRKNDNPFVEQKNWSVMRRLVGYDRYDTPRQVRQLNALYELTHLYTNHFLPLTKLVSKRREGSRVIKTPYQRVLDSSEVTRKHKAALVALKPSKVPPSKLQ